LKTFYLMLAEFFFPVFVVTLLFFVLVFQLMDLFSNLWRYISHDVPLRDMAFIAYLYLPKCISYSTPIALLFSCSYVLGSYYMNNELISVFGSGVSLYSFVVPLVVAGVLLSAGGFFFEDRVVIDSFKRKNDYFRFILNQTVSYSNSNVTVLSDDNAFVYQVNYYNDKQASLAGVTVVQRNERNRLIMRIEAERGEWTGRSWRLHNCRIFRPDGDALVEQQVEVYDSAELSARPGIFRRISRDIDEMSAADAGDYIRQLRRAGLPYQDALTKYYRKFAFSLTPLIVVLISSAIGGLFKKNVLLMSLVSSLAIVVVYYVVQMVTMTLARNGYLPPVFGSWSSFVLFFGVGIGLFRFART